MLANGSTVYWKIIPQVIGRLRCDQYKVLDLFLTRFSCPAMSNTIGSYTFYAESLALHASSATRDWFATQPLLFLKWRIITQQCNLSQPCGIGSRLVSRQHRLPLFNTVLAANAYFPQAASFPSIVAHKPSFARGKAQSPTQPSQHAYAGCCDAQTLDFVSSSPPPSFA